MVVFRRWYSSNKVFERNPCVGLVLYLLHNLAERVAGYRVAVFL